MKPAKTQTTSTKNRFAPKEHKLNLFIPKPRLYEFHMWLDSEKFSVVFGQSDNGGTGYKVEISSDDQSLLILAKLTWGGN